jgi:predicted RNA-binding protein associated with RNAse of E/G family
VHEEPDVRVTYSKGVKLKKPIVVDGAVALEPGSDVVWFTFPGAWHDIGRFHLADGTFTGLYTNVLTPPVFETDLVWHTTDLFLDVWMPAGGGLQVLDRDEFDAAVDAGLIDDATRGRALAEVESVLSAAEEGAWPPPVVEGWPLARVRSYLSSEPSIR